MMGFSRNAGRAVFVRREGRVFVSRPLSGIALPFHTPLRARKGVFLIESNIIAGGRGYPQKLRKPRAAAAGAAAYF